MQCFALCSYAYVLESAREAEASIAEVDGKEFMAPTNRSALELVRPGPSLRSSG